ncbi:ISL3 family transposase [Marinitoga sp. 1197]|uniref:ISL3 family transposase n=1 Tax=Marinitoga sp. 1197 TaxID=1428449 RepID=UPI000641284A|nr:ISL3 family transposase [Marinitoga sp. 1197]
MMNELPRFFEKILNINEPWRIEKIEQDGNKVNIYVNFKRGAKFEINGKRYGAYDTVKKTWRHLNLFQYETYIHARVPRIKTEDGIKIIEVPWSRPNSGFTLLFEAFVLEMYQHMTVAEISKKYKVTENRIWRILEHHVMKELKKQDFSKEPIKILSVDEIARKKNHVYVTNFVDVERGKVVFIAKGKDAKTFKKFKTKYIEKKGKVSDIKTICMDMSVAFKSGAKEHFPKAKLVFDKFHIIKLLNEQLNKIRKRESKDYKDLLNKTKYIFLKNPKNLTNKQNEKLEQLMEYKYLDTVKAYSLILELKKIFDYKKPAYASKFFKKWYDKTLKSNIPEMKKAAKSLYKHIKGILMHLKTGLTNAKIEGMNSKLRTFTKRAYGFKSFKYLSITIFLALGKLSFS